MCAQLALPVRAIETRSAREKVWRALSTAGWCIVLRALSLSSLQHVCRCTKPARCSVRVAAVATDQPATDKSSSAETIKQFEDAAFVDKSRSGASTVSSGFKLDNVRAHWFALSCFPFAWRWHLQIFCKNDVLGHEPTHAPCRSSRLSKGMSSSRVSPGLVRRGNVWVWWV